MLILARTVGELIYASHHPAMSDFDYSGVRVSLEIRVLDIQRDRCRLQVNVDGQPEATSGLYYPGQMHPLYLPRFGAYPDVFGAFGLHEIRRGGFIDGRVPQPQARLCFDCPRSVLIFRAELRDKRGR